MNSYNELITLIDAVINRNGVQAITGQVLNGVLKAMVQQLGAGYSLSGVAHPTDDPGTPERPVCYFASMVGTYTNFGGVGIVAGELALLCYDMTDGWFKETMYEGFQEVTASVDENVGIPSVNVTYVDGVLSFDFSNLKGESGADGNDGQDGQDGAAAGFGTISASVDANVGTPSVAVTESGPDTAKNLAFAFHNLKGADGDPGVTSVNVTVDNTSGSPACAVSLNAGVLTLAFTGLKGAQGDTGSSVAYPFTIVNNLTTDDATQALSAAMGVQLEGEISQLEHEVGDVEREIGFAKTTGRSQRTLVAGTDYTTASGYVVASGSYFHTSSDFKMSSAFELKAGDTLDVRASAPSSVCVIAKVSSAAATTATPLVVGSAWNTVNTYSYTATEDCLIRVSWQVSNGQPDAVISGNITGVITTSDIGEIRDDVAEINQELELNEYPIESEFYYHLAVYQSDGHITFDSSFSSRILPISEGMEKLKFKANTHLNYGYGFILSDGTWQSEYVSGDGVKTVTVPSGAKEFRMCYKPSSFPENPILVTGRRTKMTELSQDYSVSVKRNLNNLYDVAEANNRGRFDYLTVGVNDYINAFNELSYTFPDFKKMTDIGTSQQPNAGETDQNIYPIVRYRYTKATANPTKMLCVMGGIHGDSENPGVSGWKNNGGDSPQNILSVYFFLLDLLMNPEKDAYHRELTDNFIIDVVPIINPWGVQNHSRTNGRDVDLNRNFDYNWASCTDTKKGASAFSEAESQAYRDYITARIAESSTPLKLVIEVHSRGNLITSNDGRFWGVGPNVYTDPDVRPLNATQMCAAKYGTGSPGWQVYTSENAEPMGWAWTNWVKNIPSFNPECCQSIFGDISTRNSRLVNAQMADFVSTLILVCLGIIK